jgi:hypothetical protein
MDETELYNHVISRFTPDELCEILDISTEQFADKFYDEIMESPAVRSALGLVEETSNDGPPW